MNLKTLVFCVSVALSAPAMAVQHTYASPKDQRIRFVDYDENDIVTIFGKVGTDTMIVFEPGEQIQDMSGGDTAAWAVGVTTSRNAFFMKPSATSPATNMHVVTTRRVYSIDLKLASRGQPNYLTVRYRYPTQEAAKQQAAAEARRTRDALSTGVPGARKNYSYSAQGSSDIAPVEAWDDGTATFLRFAPNATVPAAYVVAEDGKEHLVNTSMQGDVLRVQKVAAKLILRGGDLVACIFNDAYDSYGTRTETGTASPAVQRIIKGRQK
jgi:type IV secretion system protein VirB9